MIKMTPAEFENAIEIEIQGKVTEEDIHNFEEFFLLKRQHHDKVNILMVYNDWEGISLKGLLEDLKLMKYTRDINKIAVVSDKKWIEKGAKLEGLIPSISMEHFLPENKAQANRWLAT
ncbi:MULTISPECIES: SpoIIAA family protein [Virgibacillus]|uniref:STAS/SEC14 domain-containing protein n=2 Tax=Virgibacillus TaxID=84406 RepID=A0A024QEG0_9BACI|nr:MULTISPECIES: STAS/SEC14 domain-containing protein [Virgibacillus]EQB35282.1 hypothetical protein M948_19475 [Virgibacillus sp. CM-4]GGJ76057.1 hypothetical protein GCM10007111_42010 [Virgibacillus kapii]CDQ40575.1 hypothetical protein BN990_02900 [Virgibacillus massiliensis]